MKLTKPARFAPAAQLIGYTLVVMPLSSVRSSTSSWRWKSQ